MEVREVFDTLEYGPAPESAALAREWLQSRGRRFGLFIDGAWREPADAGYFDTLNPANAQSLASIALASADDVDAAVNAARGAFRRWASLSGHVRARYLYAIARQIQKHSREFAVIETLDNGKPIRESRDIDVPLVIRHFHHHAGWAQVRDAELPGYEPIGVVGQIIPWNFPLLMLAWKVAPALAMGNTVVLKPAEYTSLTALRFAELCHEVGLPKGVVNIVTGDGRTGELLVQHPGVDKIAFTGSTDVGRIIRTATAGTGKKVSLELGGKSPFIVFDDADLDSVVEGVVDAIWFNQGQVCCAGSRILVQEGVAPRLIEKLRARMERLRVGDPLDKAIDIGAIIAQVQLERIDRLVRLGVSEGARMWQPSWTCPEDGWFFPPTLFTEVAPAATIAQVEIFGPVVVLMTFRTHREAIDLANNTRYGLAASVWTESVNLALDVAPKLKAGTVWINSTNMFDAASGFGGYRESGFGREGGKEGLFEYVRPAWQGRSRKGSSRTAAKASAGSESSDAQAHSVETVHPGRGDSPDIDRTAKLYIGGRQVRPDSGYSLPVYDRRGRVIAEAGRGNRKDVRNAVEAANASSWPTQTAYNRAQVLYYLAENLFARRNEFVKRLRAFTSSDRDAAQEFDLSVERLFLYAAYADKWESRVHHVPQRMVTLAMREPVGVLGVVCPDERPLLGFVSCVAPALALGNTVVVVPSESAPLVSTDFYQVADTSDLPAGALNIITGTRAELVPHIASHDDIEGVWYFPSDDGGGEVERQSAGNMKRTWIAGPRDWKNPVEGAGEEFLRHATEFKNIWIPYGE